MRDLEKFTEKGYFEKPHTDFKKISIKINNSKFPFSQTV